MTALVLTILSFLLPVLALAFGLVSGVGVAPAVVSACTSVVFYLLAWGITKLFPAGYMPVWLAWMCVGVFGLLLGSWAYCLAWSVGVVS